MYTMHMYRDGSLPVIRQSFHTAHLQVLRCSYWVIRLWHHANLASPYWRLYWNRDAGAEVYWGDQRFLLGPEQLLLIAPNTPFTTRLCGNAGAPGVENIMQGCPAAEWDGIRQSGEVYMHHFFTHFIAGLPYDSVAARIFTIPIDRMARNLIEEILVPVAVDRLDFNRQQSFQLRALLHYALSHVPEDVWPTLETDERVVAVMRFVETQYARHLTNDDFAGIAAMSAKAFVRLFKSKTGQTPLAYVQQRRLEHASILLHHTDESIERIAERCGFYDRHHFSRLFQRAFAIGPASYRKTRVL